MARRNNRRDARLVGGAKQTVTGIAESGNDVALFVEVRVKGTQHDLHVSVTETLFHRGNTLGSANETNAGHVFGSAFEHIVDRVDQGSTGGKHRVDDVNLPTGEVFGQAVCISEWFEGFLVALDSQETDLRGWQKLDDSFEHSEPRAQNRNDDWPWAAQLDADGGGHGGFDAELFDRDIPGGFIGEQRDKLFDEQSEHWRRGVLVAKHGQLVGDQGMVGNKDSHRLNLYEEDAVNDRFFAPMREALAEAALAASESDDVPVGAVLIDAEGNVVARGHNLREATGDPTAHAEVVAVRAAAASLAEVSGANTWRLEDLTLVVSLEPCVMCAGAIVAARIPRVVFGAWDERVGAAGSRYDLLRDSRLGPAVEVIGGVLEDECSAVLTQFFESKRMSGSR